MPKLKIAILGSGNIGTDLLVKVLRSQQLECRIFLGRNLDSAGMRKAAELGVPVSDRGIHYLIDNPQVCELVFDATSAHAHLQHAPILEKMKLPVIDLTPARLGLMCVPYLSSSYSNLSNLNMVTCSGQASIPLAYALAQTHSEVDYIEVISSIASQSAGPATRHNLDEHIETTEEALQVFSGAKKTKVILNLNPAVPQVHMQTTVLALVKNLNLAALTARVNAMIAHVQTYVPGYELTLAPQLEHGRVAMMVRVKGLGDYLPSFAGNLDIMNCAALAVAHQYSQRLK